MNHPSWWDPLVALVVARKLFPERSHYAPIDAAELERYRFFGNMGMFGIVPGSAGGAARFLSIGEDVLSLPGTVLWVTAQGSFTDPRVRPTVLRSGLAHLLRRLPGAVVLPIAIEYPFWVERYPEALVRCGETISIDPSELSRPAGLTLRIAERLEQAQDCLRADSLSKNCDAFEILVGGRSGVGGFYDMGRRTVALMRGERFRRSHGAEDIL